MYAKKPIPLLGTFGQVYRDVEPKHMKNTPGEAVGGGGKSP